MNDAVATAFAQRMDKWRLDPVTFIWEVGGERLWSKQRELARAVQKNPRVAVPSAHNMGKSRIASWLSWWWVLCHRVKTLPDGSRVPATSKVVITAPSFGSLQEILGANIIARWDEMKARLPKEVAEILGLGIRPTQGGWTAPWSADCGIEWFSTREDDGKATGHASKAAGRHADHLLFIFEEFGGIAKTIYDSIQGSLSGEHRHFLGIGNPVDPTSIFAKCCRSPAFAVIPVSWYDFPNIKEGKNVLPYGPTAHDLEEFKKDPGEDSPDFQWKVMGQFPSSASDTLISQAVFTSAMNRSPDPTCNHPPAAIGIGCDVARFGDDESTIPVICRDCGALLDLEVRHGQDTVAIANLLVGVAVGWDLDKATADQICVDCGGGDVGAGVVDHCKFLGWNVRAVAFGSKATTEKAQKKFQNRRVQLWVEYRDWLKTKAALLGFDRAKLAKLQEESCSVKTDFGPDQRRRLESKDALKLRLGKSPDYADGAALAVASLKPAAVSKSRSAEEGRNAADPFWERDNRKPREDDGVQVGGRHRDVAAELRDW